MSVEHDFLERMNFSQGIDESARVEDLLLRLFPEADGVERAHNAADRHGTDYWIKRYGRPWMSVDMKHRSTPRGHYGRDDICIETTSIYTGPKQPPWLDAHRKQPGWSVDPAKETDWIIYTWPDGAAREWYRINFHLLRSVSVSYWREWAERYGELRALNPGYLTLSVYPFRQEVEDCIKDLSTGRSIQPGDTPQRTVEKQGLLFSLNPPYA